MHADGRICANYVKSALFFTGGGRSFGRHALFLLPYRFCFTNRALTLLATSIVTVQVGVVPVHAPLQPAKA